MNSKGFFTLPGEAGYEKLTLELADKWGADVIRDSDGTALSEELYNAGYGVYSTICVIRDHNEWARANGDKLQQCFLCTPPKIAPGECLLVDPMEDFFSEQFAVNDSPESIKLWQVYDRTSNRLLEPQEWEYENCVVAIRARKWHKYTVSFVAYRIWEEISMYNHTTNNWNKEKLMQIDPIHPETREYLLEWMKNWCAAHPATTAVRFTSLFYNFVWIWGANERNRHLFTDWASYDFTVSPLALALFEKKYGYALTAEDFVNKGKYRVTHSVPDRKKRDWMEFINNFVISFGKELVDIVHKYGKKAYVFYDDSWVGIEPYGKCFSKFGFDGIIKCVFSGFEARLCAGVKVDTHEIRLHPYLFPVGLGGAPTFKTGGNPKCDAAVYWGNVRRALLRQSVDRIGLGGYLHLVEGFPDFVEYIAKIADEFRAIRDLHESGVPRCFRPKVAILHAWGKLRSWTLSGHFHETYMHDLIHVLESLSGMPFEVEFLDFDEIKDGIPEEIKVIINAGRQGSAWSGGTLWKDDKITENLSEWVHEKGGVFIGINEPSAVEGFDTLFRMAHVLGLDIDRGERVCHGKWKYDTNPEPGLVPSGIKLKPKAGLYLTGVDTRVLAEMKEVDGTDQPVLTINKFGFGKGVYMPSFEYTPENTRLLYNVIVFSLGLGLCHDLIAEDINIDCVYFPKAHVLAVANNSNRERNAVFTLNGLGYEMRIEPYGFITKKL